MLILLLKYEFFWNSKFNIQNFIQCLKIHSISNRMITNFRGKGSKWKFHTYVYVDFGFGISHLRYNSRDNINRNYYSIVTLGWSVFHESLITLSNTDFWFSWQQSLLSPFHTSWILEFVTWIPWIPGVEKALISYFGYDFESLLYLRY